MLLFSGVHVLTADTNSPAGRATWIAQLDAMLARGPAIVVPGHMTPEASRGTTALTCTRDYLRAFEEGLAKNPTAPR